MRPGRHDRLPVVEMLRRYQEEDLLGLCCPGHKDGREVDPDVLSLLGGGAFRADVTQVPGIDDLLAPCGAIEEAQALAAETWGARQTWFLTNGTTSGVQAAMLACCQPGDRVLVSRASHRSVLEGLVLTGAIPVWIPCDVDPLLGCALPPTESAVEEALAQAGGVARMAILTRPTYHGDTASARLIGSLSAGGTIVLVDEAWGAHLGFHSRLPPSACGLGADVVVNSTHKTCGALSGGSMLHLASDRVKGDRLASAVGLVTTTSPYYGVLASLDGARRQMALRGSERLERILLHADGLRRELQRCEGIEIAGADRVDRLPGVAGFDETRVVFSAWPRGCAGFQVEAALREQAQIQVELADARAVIMLVGEHFDEERARRLVDVVASIGSLVKAGAARDEVPSLPSARTVMTPREAFFAPREPLPLRQSLGRVSADVVCTYPPGIPLLFPGEEIGPDMVDVLEAHSRRGGRTQGLVGSSSCPASLTVGVLRT